MTTGAVMDNLRIYCEQISQVPLLTAEEEVALAKRIEAGRNACEELRTANLCDEQRKELDETVRDGEQARTHFTEANTGLVVSVAKKYQGLGVPLLDLIQEGNIGLMRAVEKFDYRRGFRFSSYATWWIRQAITVALSQQGRLIRLPEYVNARVRRISHVIEQFEQEERRPPTLDELTEQTGLTGDEIERLMDIPDEPLSLEKPVSNDSKTEFGDFIEDAETPAPTDVVYRQLLREALEQATTVLSGRDARILMLRFGLRDGRGHSLAEVGKKVGLSHERIRQIEREALERLKQYTHLRDFLS